MTTVAPDPLDLHHEGAERVIGVYLLETEDGLALQDCGPSTCITKLKGQLAERALVLSDVRHLLLSHIHLDHAGAAGTLVREHPGLQVHVSEIGAPHLVDPSRLESSARRLYGDDFDRLWGELAPVPQENVHVVALVRARARVLPVAGPRSAPRLLRRRRRHALRGRRGGRPDRARPSHPARGAAARDRPRGVGADDRRARAARAGAPRADPLRRRRPAARPPAAPSPSAAPLGPAGSAGNGRGGVRRGGPRRSRGRHRRCAVLRASRAVLAVVPRAQALLGQGAPCRRSS